MKPLDPTPSLLPGHAPKPDQVRGNIGPYEIIDDIGEGGMGEVLLAYDTRIGRRIALKKIREELIDKKLMHDRFIREARITAQLTHPSIIPIYSILDENETTYYTMPFVQGETLKRILLSTRRQEKKGEELHHIGGSIPALIRIFIQICQAVAYAHSQGVLHRDLKPENIIVGRYGEVLILDWGLAQLIRNNGDEEEGSDESIPDDPELTHAGKIVGTVTFMAPERALGNPATIQADIYSLGVMLFQMLTLRSPFQRVSLKEFRKNIDKEILYDPGQIAPYREVPRVLSNITLKCLDPDPKKRYTSVDKLLRELENYIEGRAEWFQTAELDPENKEDWEFQEHVLIAEQIAITRSIEASEWVNLMISKGSFTGNTKIEARVRLSGKSQGIGFLLSIPEVDEREHLNDGYCLWLGSDKTKNTKLLRSTVEVLNTPEIYLPRDEWVLLSIEKIDNNLYIYLNGSLQFSYISHVPLTGTHIGILSRDAHHEIEDLQVYTGSQTIMVNCLAIPDAFLAHKQYSIALAEYRRIGYSFPRRAEGREAMFRAGITLMDQARNTSDERERTKLFEEALDEFEKLHGTPGAPFEYIGKSLVYRTLGDLEEEGKCLELAFRRYKNHPLLPALQEQTVYRMYDTSRYHRKATYNFALLALRHLPKKFMSRTAKKLFNSLQSHWEPLYFINLDDPKKEIRLAIQIAFWLGKPYILEEICQSLFKARKKPLLSIGNAVFSLIELGAYETANSLLESLYARGATDPWMHAAITCHQQSLAEAVKIIPKVPKELEKAQLRIIFHLMEQALDTQQFDLFEHICHRLDGLTLDDEADFKFKTYQIWALLWQKNWEVAGDLLHEFPLSVLTQETTPLHFLYGCWLHATEGKEISDIHLSAVLDVSYPRSWLLANHYLFGKITDKEWLQKAFLYEKRQLYRQLALYHHCVGDDDKAKRDLELARECWVNPD